MFLLSLFNNSPDYENRQKTHVAFPTESCRVYREEPKMPSSKSRISVVIKKAEQGVQSGLESLGTRSRKRGTLASDSNPVYKRPTVVYN
jgi:hypothetical protein